MDIPIPTFMWKRNTQELPRTLWNRRMMRGAPPVIYQDIQQRYKKSNNKSCDIALKYFKIIIVYNSDNIMIKLWKPSY